MVLIIEKALVFEGSNLKIKKAMLHGLLKLNSVHVEVKMSNKRREKYAYLKTYSLVSIVKP